MEAEVGLAGLAKKLFDRRTHISPEVLQKSIPLRNPVVIVVSDNETGILLQAPLSPGGKGWLSTLAKKTRMPDVKRFELEPTSAFVWRLCDGKHTFEGISRKLREEFKMKRAEADAALGAFLQMLSQRQLITLMVKEQK